MNHMDRAMAMPAEVCETHTAVIFFFGDRAYKVKKPVNLGFLDFSSVTTRRADCQREVDLNRRFAPDVYVGVGEFQPPGTSTTEPLVVMRRMPASRRLSHLVSMRLPVTDALRATARLVATCHANAPRDASVASEGTRDALLGRWEQSFAQVHTLIDATGELPGQVETESLVRRYLAGRQALFDARIREGRVIDGHGDLLAEDVFCLDDGPRILDCLEFDDRLRHVDGLDDAAFLAMDLEKLGAPDDAEHFLACYGEYSADPAPPSLWHHYVAYRAYVRAKVSLIQASQGAAQKAMDAERYARLTLRHLRTAAVKLVLVGGLPGTGKSTLSGSLADRLGACLLSSDRLRKEISGISPEESAGAAYGCGIYTPRQTRRTYATLLHHAQALLERGESVVVDASWTAAEQREAATDVAGRTSADLVALRCEVPAALAARRLDARAAGASDADRAIAEAMAVSAEAWPQAVTLDTSQPLAVVTDQAMTLIRGPATDHARPLPRPYMRPD